MTSFKIATVLEKRFPIIVNETSFQKNGFVFGFQPVEKDKIFVCCGLTTSLEHVPTGNSVLGVFQFDGANESLISIAKDCSDKLLGHTILSSLIVLNYKTQDNILKAHIWNGSSLEDIEFEVINFTDEYASKLVQINVKISIKIVNDNGKLVPNNIQTKSEDFRLNDSKFKLTANQKKAKTIADLYSQLELSDIDGLDAVPANMKKKFIEKEQNKLKTQRSPLTFSVRNSSDENSTNKSDLELIDGSFLNINTIIMLQMNQTISSLINLLLSLEQSTIKAFWNATNDSKTVPELFTFFDSEQYAHTITAFYSFGDEEKETKQRDEIHQRYFIPRDRPYFGKFQALNSNLSRQGALLNVHEGLKLPMNEGIVANVFGKYLYYHYAQQNMIDSGWGCAYRSLQTIVSWFQLQGYTTKNVPTHRQIQEALVACGDKPSSFIGSSKWIGSQEVSFVLSQLFQIQSKIMFVSSGSELGNKSRELIKHFQDVGTPIMIGGGVLAHTILGIHFNESNGNVYFLVLDPHYVGLDEITNIHKKSGISWKPLSFWSKSDFYNLCLPQRPKIF